MYGLYGLYGLFELYVRSIRIIWIIWNIWIVDCTDSSHFVSWKRSPRKRPRPGTRKGINRAAAWRACERPPGPCLWSRRCGTFRRSSELWLSNTAIGRAGDLRRTGGHVAGESVLGLIGACWALRRLKMALRWLQEVPRRAKMRQDAPKRAPRRPKTPPRRPKTPPRRPKMPPRCPRTWKMEPKWSQVGTEIASKIDFNIKKAISSRIL